MRAEWVVIADNWGNIARAVVNDIDAQAAVLALVMAGFIIVRLASLLCHVHLAMLRHIVAGLWR